MQLIAVSLIGIPSSGKTSLAHKLVEMSRNGLLQAGVVVISFDDHIQIDFSDVSQGDYKKGRESLLRNIEDLMKQLKDNQQNLWMEILASHELKINLHHIKLNYPSLIVFDDNMYYRSMRKRVRAICRNLNCRHFQIFMETSLDDAIQRNLQRLNKVPESIIEKMHQQLEMPGSSRTIFIETKAVTDDALLLMLHDRIANPEKIEDSTTNTPQQQSLIHELDIITRKEMSGRIKSLGSVKGIPEICATLNRKRKEFLEDLRTQTLDTADVESLRTAFNCYLDK